jgi:hypothetical protein
MRKKFKLAAFRLLIISILWLLMFLPFSSNCAASSDADLIIELDLRYLTAENGGGECLITVQNELARDIRHNILEDSGFNPSNSSNISKTISDNFVEAFEDLMELNINQHRKDYNYDEDPQNAGVDYEGFYKIIEIDRVDVKSVEGLEGTNASVTTGFSIKFDIKGPLLEDQEILLSDGYILLYALWGTQNPPPTVDVEETVTLTTVGVSSYSDYKLDSGGEITLYRLGLGNYIEYKI